MQWNVAICMALSALVTSAVQRASFKHLFANITYCPESSMSQIFDSSEILMAENEDKSSISLIGCQAKVYVAGFSTANVIENKGSLFHFNSYETYENCHGRPKKILVTSNSRLQYVGSNYENDAYKVTSSLLKVGIYNKKTHKFKLWDADYFQLKPVLKCNIDVKKEEKSWREKTEDLALTFGNKNRKRLLNSRLKYGSASNDSIESSISSLISGNLKNLDTEETKQESEIIPFQNNTAKRVNEVYNISDIIPEEEYHCLDAEANIFIGVTRENLQLWRSEPKFCNFIIHALELKRQSISIHVAKLLYYLHYLTILLKCTYKDVRRKDPFPDIPNPYKASLMKRFLIDKSMPQRMKDKVLAHAMVLALTIDNYCIDGKLLASSTGVPISRIVLMAYSLGCYVHNKKSENTKSIELKLPLNKYEPRGNKKK
ncbi:hypothetical protein CDAR_453531 [Caerostris darwini]|uniref:Uncharacterized protein n=1 Tax=Caerostris darwini TaxID=1538125 RepID=A0AAV4T412_9ARAC|nr:hypothetical protein CDAR_453531 [Caerostris darwini]